jgi:hypothetical protein
MTYPVLNDAVGWKPLTPMQRDVLALLAKGWTTPGQALSFANCFSLSQRVGELARIGYAIERDWLKLDGKQVRKYRIAQ